MRKILCLLILGTAISAEAKLGIRLGLGASDFYNHKAFVFDEKNMGLGMGLSYSLGFIYSIDINNVFSIAPGLQYSYYSASNEFTVKTDSAGFDDMNEVSLYMQSFEMPILLRFNIGSFYLEAGPQIGYNNYAKISINNESKKPNLNAFAFGPSIGGGINTSGGQFGIRAYLGITEYAKNLKGYPWNIQFNLISFFY